MPEKLSLEMKIHGNVLANTTTSLVNHFCNFCFKCTWHPLQQCRQD